MNELDKKLNKIFSHLRDRNADPDSDDLKDWVLNWDMLNDDVKKTLEALKGEYGIKKAMDMYSEMSLMDAMVRKQKREEEKTLN